jgi:uncharacterized membrane protein YfcA
VAFHGDVDPLVILPVGLAAGGLLGLFGGGGAAFATPVLALVGVPGAFALASPLPALIPASLLGARGQLKTGNLDRRVAGLAMLGGLPGSVLGGLASSLVSGHVLVLLSALLLLGVGVRVMLPDPTGHADRCAGRHANSSLIVALAFGVGLLAGLLANGGGFLLVPTFIVLLGLSTVVASGTSMVTGAVLSIPTLLVHWSLGHIDWSVTLVFALGVLPGTLVGTWLTRRVPTDVARKAFGVLLVVFSVAYLVH